MRNGPCGAQHWHALGGAVGFGAGTSLKLGQAYKSISLRLSG
jgi:hypothetical protein